MKRLSLVLLVLWLSANLLTACGVGDSPEKAAREWMEAVAKFDGSGIARRTCDAKVEEVKGEMVFISIFPALAKYFRQEVKVDVSDLQFETIKPGDKTAVVHVTGEMRAAVLGIWQSQKVDEKWYMVKESGRWKWCGESTAFVPTPTQAITSIAAPKPTPSPTYVQELYVPEDYPRIQLAINAIEDGGIVIVSPGTYEENIDFKGKDITVRSTNPDDPDVVAATIIEGKEYSQSAVTFKREETSKAVLAGFTITKGSGGIYVGWGSSPMIINNIISGNETSSGGGIYVGGRGSSPTIRGNTITDNKASSMWDGGGIYVNGGSSPLITDNTISGNEAGRGGGISVFKSSPTIISNTISNNAGNGGGIYVCESSARLTENTITNNADESGGISEGGGISVEYDSSSTITGNTISGNKADEGGGICIRYDSSSTITGNTISGNKADKGGGIYVKYDASPMITENIISTNRATSGGGIGVMDSSPEVMGNTFEKNEAGKGGAIYVSGDSFLKLNKPDDNSYINNVPDDILYE